MPGPPVVVCKNDKVIVDVLNALPADTTSIHFHGNTFSSMIQRLFRILILMNIYTSHFIVSFISIGQHHRDGYQYYDGVPYVTQCPIYPGLR